MLSRIFSPYQLNPFNYNPLKAILEEVVDFKGLRRRSAVKVFLSATNVRTGKIRVFSGDELCVASVLASSCLLLFSQAIEIDGEHFWDGGYLGNPALFPLIYECESCDVVIVHINPTERLEIPKTAPEIINRINESVSIRHFFARYVQLHSSARLSTMEKVLMVRSSGCCYTRLQPMM
jgi:NTE family protein